MMTHVSSNTYVNGSPEPRILVITQAPREFGTADYESEARQVVEFLREVFCLKTLDEVSSLLNRSK